MQTATETRYVGCAELSRIIGLSQRTIQEYYRCEGLPHIRVGRAVRFRPDLVIAWLEKRYGQNCPTDE